MGLVAIAVAILALAAINYVNLATVRVLRRQREIGMRKVLGAGVQQIISQFLAESLLVALTATALGLLLAWLALPLFAQLMNRTLDDFFSPFNMAAAAVIGVLLGAACSIYPAWIAIHIHPAQVLVGRPGTESTRGKRLRQLLTIAQMAVAMGLAGVTLAIAWQTHFAMEASPGFDPAPLLIVDLPEDMKNGVHARGLMDALLRQPGVTGIAIATDAVGRSKSRWGMDIKREGGADAFLEMKSVSANFFEEYHIKPVAGRLFDPQIDKEDDAEPIVLNTVEIHALGFPTPESALGQLLSNTGFDGKPSSKRIIGVAPELRFFSLHEAPRATAWELWTQGSTLSVRSSIPLGDLEQKVRDLWPNYFPNEIPEIHFANDILAANYEDDARLAKLLAIATALAMTIAAMGIYALSAYTVQHRTKEIVLRKLYGARNSNIAALVLREIGALIMIAAAVALPLAAIMIERYLAGYVEHAPIGYWTLLLALGAATTTALIAVARQAWLAMRMMPAAALTL
jgi:cell division protein FtsX